MPIRDPLKRKEYQRELMRRRRQGLGQRPRPNVSPSLLDPDHVSLKEKVVSPENVKPCSNCQRLQQTVDYCFKRHAIPKEADFIELMWDRRNKKFVFYNCSDSCWEGKFCNNCSSLEQQLINRIKQKSYEN